MLDKLQKLELEDLIEFRDHGDMKKAPSEIVEYVRELEKIHSMSIALDKFGSRDAIVNHLTKFNGYSHYLAGKLHDDAMEYFYADRKVSFQGYVYRMAEQMEKAINTALVLAKDANEIMKAVAQIPKIVEMVKAAQPETLDFPLELLQKPVKLYSSSAEDLGMPAINRYELGRLIDDLPDITEAQKIAAKRDAQLLPLKIFTDDQS